jgi:hypothetical protein
MSMVKTIKQSFRHLIVSFPFLYPVYKVLGPATRNRKTFQSKAMVRHAQWSPPQLHFFSVINNKESVKPFQLISSFNASPLVLLVSIIKNFTKINTVTFSNVCLLGVQNAKQ